MSTTGGELNSQQGGGENSISLKTNGDFRIWSCLRRGWGLFWRNFKVCMLASLPVSLGLLLCTVLPRVLKDKEMRHDLLEALGPSGPLVILSFTLVLLVCWIFLILPLVGGLFAMLMKLALGQPAGAGDVRRAAFGQKYWELVLGNLVPDLFTALLAIPVLIPTFFLILILDKKMELPGSVLLFVFFLLNFAVVIFLWSRWRFTLPLIIARNLNYDEAMRESTQLSKPFALKIFGLVVLCGVCNLVGESLCFVGFLFSFPITIAAVVFAYQDVIRMRSTPSNSLGLNPAEFGTEPSL